MTWGSSHGQAGKRHRTVVIELDGLLHLVPAEYDPTGVLVGRMVTARAFYAESRFGECPVPVAMPLHRPTAGTDPRLIVVDDLDGRWVMGFNVLYNQTPYRITGFYPGWRPEGLVCFLSSGRQGPSPRPRECA